MKTRIQFGIRTLMLLSFLTAIGLLIWRSLPTEGEPILRGRITDVSGNPIPDVEIILHSGIATRFPGQRTTTNRNGQYSFDPLRTGSLTAVDDNGLITLQVGIRVNCSGYRPVDGMEWWEVDVPMIKKRKHTWNLIMQRDCNSNTNHTAPVHRATNL